MIRASDFGDFRVDRTTDLLTQTTEAINSLNLSGCSPDTLRELVDVRDAAERAIRAVEASMKEV